VLEYLAKEVTKGVDGILRQRKLEDRERREWDLVVDKADKGKKRSEPTPNGALARFDPC
jgi:hypothetical protein